MARLAIAMAAAFAPTAVVLHFAAIVTWIILGHVTLDAQRRQSASSTP